MNKSDIVARLAAKEGISEAQAAKIVNLVFETFAKTMEDGERIQLRGFGSFSVREYGEYTGRNPRSGETFRVGPKKVPYFKVGKGLSGRVNP
jgi:integration host factor subunit beta